jgi:hypothetical protein
VQQWAGRCGAACRMNNLDVIVVPLVATVVVLGKADRKEERL